MVQSSGSSTAGDPFGFGAQDGYYTDQETNLVLCTFRYYDPANGRWLNRDPIGYAGGLNLYAYCSGNPINFTDPLGWCSSAWYDQWHTAMQAAVGTVKDFIAANCDDLLIATTTMSAFDVVGGVLDSPHSLFNIGKGTGEAWDSGDPLKITGAAAGDIANAVGFAMAGASPLASAGEAALGNIAKQATGALDAEAANSAVNAGESTPVYRGTSRPDIPQVSRSMRGKPIEEVPSGSDNFMTNDEAWEHAFHGRGFHPDGVSVTTDMGTAKLFRSHTIEYRVPKSVFDRLPAGDSLQGEKVFKYSIPEEYRVGVKPNK